MPPASSGLGAEHRPRCIRHRGGAAGPRAARAALGPQEDHTGRHVATLCSGNHSPIYMYVSV